MEPTNLNSSAPDDAAFDSWLQTNNQLPELPDDGFTQRAISALPVPDRRYVQRSWYCAAGLVVGTLLALTGTLVSQGVIHETEITAFEQTLFSPASLTALAITAGSLAYAFQNELRRLLRF